MGTVNSQKCKRICAFCKHWNGVIGSTTMTPISITLVSFDSNEKHPCWLTANPQNATYTCGRFELRDYFKGK